MAAKQPQDHKTPKNQPKTVEVMGVTLAVSPAIFDDLDMVEYLYDLQAAQEGDGAGAFRHRSLPQEAVRPPVHGHEGRIARPRHRAREHRQGRDIIAQLLEQVAPNS